MGKSRELFILLNTKKLLLLIPEVYPFLLLNQLILLVLIPTIIRSLCLLIRYCVRWLLLVVMLLLHYLDKIKMK